MLPAGQVGPCSQPSQGDTRSHFVRGVGGWLETFVHERYLPRKSLKFDPRLHEQLNIILEDMKKNYTYLTNMQAHAITSTPDEPLYRIGVERFIQCCILLRY